MKLKLDESGNAVLQDGKPVYVHDDGREIPFDAPGAMQKISDLNAESKKHRLNAEGLQSKLSLFGDVEDYESFAEKATKALKTVENLDDKKLIDAGEIEKVKSQMADSFGKKISALEDKNKTLEKDLFTEKVSQRFSRSKFVTENLAVPADMIEAMFSRNFKVEDGTVVGYLNGEKILSDEKPGEIADFEESISKMVNIYPNKDSILKSKAKPGGGTPPEGGGGGSGGDLTKLSPVERLKAARRAGG